MTQVSVCQSLSYIVCTPPPFLQGGGVEPPTKFKEKWGLAGPQLLEGGLLGKREGVQLSHNKLKSEIFKVCVRYLLSNFYFFIK